MNDQAAATPNAGPTSPQAASPATANEKTSEEIRDAVFLSTYDILRPAGEVDSRAQAVLVSAIVLVALCVVPEKPKTFDIGGVPISLKNWLTLAIPLCLVVIYMTVELVVAWQLQWKRVKIKFKDLRWIFKLLYTEVGPLVTRAAPFYAESDAISAKRKEINEWYDQRSKEVDEQNRALEQDDRFPEDSAAQRYKNYLVLKKEREQREEAAGITAFDKKVDEMIKTGFDQDDKVLDQNNVAIAELRQLLRFKKIRLALGLIGPLLVAAFSLLVFVWAICKK